MTLGGEAIGLLAKSNEGRPTKIEGNPDHPQSLGATDARTQASLLDMYDPDRSQEILRRGDPATWQTFMTELRARVDENRVDGGAGVRFLTETVTSPTLIAQMRQILTSCRTRAGINTSRSTATTRRRARRWLSGRPRKRFTNSTRRRGFCRSTKIFSLISTFVIQKITTRAAVTETIKKT
jgi:molybdopterin-containing oxidoreductase family iron-sulfur binding subunit